MQLVVSPDTTSTLPTGLSDDRPGGAMTAFQVPAPSPMLPVPPAGMPKANRAVAPFVHDPLSSGTPGAGQNANA